MKDGYTALVTGGASGIGRAAAEILGERGANVVVADMSEDGGADCVAAIENAGGRAIFVRTNVMEEDSVKAAVAAAVDAFGRLDGAINSAGLPPSGKALHMLDMAEWSRVNGVNLNGMFLSMKHEVGAMLKTGGGAIVAVSSASAVKGMIHCSDYCASKAGVTGLVRAAALDYAEQGIRINALLPGATDTPLAHRSRDNNPELVKRGSVHVPVNRMASPAEIAAVAVWLLSDEASYVTGASISADGGMTAA